MTGKLKIDLANYLSNEQNTFFKDFSIKAFDIVKNLYGTKDDTAKMTGWLNLPYDTQMFDRISQFAESVRGKGEYEQLIVFGIGGSSLGAQALIEGLKTPLWNRLSKGKRKGFLQVDFIDNLDPLIIRTILSRAKLNKTLFLVISKGGSTTETIVPMLIARDWTGVNFYRQCVFVTSEGKGLLSELAEKHSVPLFAIPEKVGGRFSVFSSTGLLPAALCGVNISEVRKGIVAADELCKTEDIRQNIAVIIALCAYFSYGAGKNIFVLMPYSTCLKRFTDWFVQLWAESLGKAGKGSTPHPAIGATDQHSQIQLFNEGPNDKLICFLKIQRHKRDLSIPDFSSENEEFKRYAKYKTGQILNIELEATRKALSENKRPNFMITLPELNEFYLSMLMYVFEFATAVTGHLLNVNPFDQPGVELAKKYTKDALIRR